MQARVVWVGLPVLICSALGCGTDGPSGNAPAAVVGGPAGASGAFVAPPPAAGGTGGVSAGGSGGASGAGGASTIGGAGGSTPAGGASAAGSGAGAGGAGAGGAAAGAGGMGGPEPMRISITMQDVAAMAQQHVCVIAELPNAQPIWIKSIHATLTPGSHHLIVDRRAADAALQSDPQVCSPTQGGDSSRLIIAQQADTQVDLPAGAAFRLDARQRVFLQLHYFNYTGSTTDIEGVVEFTLADESQGTPAEVRSLFTGQMALSLPAGQATTAEFFLNPARSGPVQVFALTSHTHSLGVRSTIERVPNQAAPDSTPIHESLDWAEPPLTVFDPPLSFTGSDGLRLRCEFMNDTDMDVRFGVRFQDEMCFLWLYYFE